jgi:hypothetical protein
MQRRQGKLPSALKDEAEKVELENRDWVQDRNVQAIGIAPRLAKEKTQLERVLKIYVTKKLPKDKCKNIVPKELKILGLESSIPTDIVEIGKVTLHANVSFDPPARPGFSVGHKTATGTLGCIVKRKGKFDPYILSNAHVLANFGVLPDAARAEILYPGKNDGGKDSFARGVRFIRVRFAGEGSNRADAAIAKVRPGEQVETSLPVIGGPIGVNSTIQVGDIVRGIGRSSDIMTGQVLDTDAVLLDVPFSKSGHKRANFKDQVMCTFYAQAGDSGAVMCDLEKRVVGLHFAGSPIRSFFNKIEFILNKLDIEILPG